MRYTEAVNASEKRMAAKDEFSVVRCQIRGIEATAASTRRTFARHMHDQFGIGVMLAGAHRSASCRGAVEAFAGDAITVNPGEIHDGAPVGESARTWKMLYIEPGVVMEAVGHITEGSTTDAEFAAPVLSRPGLVPHFRELFSILTATDAPHARMRAEELLLLLLDASLVVRRIGERAQDAPQAIRHALRLIDDTPAMPLSLDDLARESGLSRYQVLRGIAKATGLTPHAYLVQRRAQMARRLITQGTTLVQAALESGFADQSHMTRVFVRQYGVSPAMFASLAG